MDRRTLPARPPGPTRRDVLRRAAGAAVAGPALSARFAFAGGGDNRLVCVVLRGGLDGLHAIPPYGDPDYAALRPGLAVPPPGAEGGAIGLDGTFGLNPALAPLAPLYRDRQLVVIPAATTSYHARSHFDGQNVLENGVGRPHGAPDGWLNRALATLGGGERRLGLALGYVVPLIMRGPAEVRTWAPSRLPKASQDFLTRLAHVYESDPLLAAALRRARASQASAAGMMDERNAKTPGPGGQRQFVLMARMAGKFLADPAGPRVAVVESGGWDTHFRQQARLDRQFAELAEGLVALKDALGAAWHRTAVVVVSEFGRTAAENGSGGTDHGVGGIALVLGGAVRGGRIVGDWPGLSRDALYEGRDVRPTTDYRALFKAALGDHLGLAEAAIEDRVFPASRKIHPLGGLFRTI